MTRFNLENSAKELTEAIAKAPALNGGSLEDARKAVEAAQSAPIPMPEVDESWVTASSAFGDFQVRIVRPKGSTGPLAVVVYIHGGGWIIGSWITHDLLTRRLSVGANAAVAFVEYSRAPEAKYPVQIEQCYATAQWIKEQGAAGAIPNRSANAVTNPPEAEASQDEGETEEDCHLVPLEGPVTTGRLVHE